jgi:hypothetical protein
MAFKSKRMMGSEKFASFFENQWLARPEARLPGQKGIRGFMEEARARTFDCRGISESEPANKPEGSLAPPNPVCLFPNPRVESRLILSTEPGAI